MNSLKISIVLATYNGELFLQEQLDSLLLQKRKPDELVICDDCSTDLTFEIIQNFAESAPFPCKIIRNVKNMGTGFSFKTAVDKSCGDLIAFCDQDAVWSSHKLSTIMACFGKTPDAEYLISNADIVGFNGESLGYTLWEQRKFNFSLQNKFSSSNQFKICLDRAITTGMSTVITRKVALIGKDKPDDINHDCWYIFVASLIGLHGILVPESLVFYRQHNAQQFGGLKGYFFARVKSRIENTSTVLNHNLQNLNSLLEFSHSIQDGVCVKENVKILEEKLSHIEHRILIVKGSMHTAFYEMLCDVFKGRYSKYGSYKTILTDFLSRIFMLKKK